jgi:hypothetical protein
MPILPGFHSPCKLFFVANTIRFAGNIEKKITAAA